MKVPTDQRKCSGCGSTSYSKTAVWCFVGRVQCLCSDCYALGLVFANDGRVVRGLPQVARLAEHLAAGREGTR